MLCRSPETAYARLLDTELAQSRKLTGEHLLNSLEAHEELLGQFSSVADLIFALLGHRCKVLSVLLTLYAVST